VLGQNTGGWSAQVTAAAGLAAAGRPEKALAAYEAVAKELGPERLLQQPEVWEPLIRLRGMHQLRLPLHERDWSQVTQLLDALERGQTLPPGRLAVLRYDHLVAAGDPAAATALLTRALEADGDDPQLWERVVRATLGQDGLAAALRVWKRIPDALVADERLLVLRARLATRAPEDEATGILDELASQAASLPADEGKRVLSAVAASRLVRGDPAGAERAWQAILAVQPDDLQTHFAIFELACEQRDVAKVTRAADEIGRLCGTDSANGRTAAAAKVMLEVAVSRSQSAVAGKERPPQAGSLGAEAMARLDVARNLLVEAEHERPGWPVIQRLLADLELLRGDVPSAIGRLEKAVELSPENLPLIRSLVTLLSVSNRQPQARAVLRQILAATGDSVASEDMRRWASRTLADLAREGTYRDVEEAVAGLARNQDAEGKQAVEDMTLAISVLAGRPEAGAWRQAIALLSALADRRSLSPAERLQRAELLDRIGRWEDCRQDLVALAAEPETPAAMLAAVVEKLIRHDELEQAAAHLETLAAREPTGIGVIALDARLAVARDDRPAAVAAVRRLAAAGPATAKDSRQLQMTATLMEEVGLDDEADAVLGQLADRGAAGIVARAGFLARHGRTGEALDLLQANRQRLGVAALLQGAVSVLRMASVAASAEQAGRVDEWFAAARRTDRDSPALSLLEADLHGARGHTKEAAAIYRKLLAGGNLPPAQRVIVQNNLAMQLARPETAAEAKELIDEAIAEQGPHPSLLDTQGLVLLAGGAPSEAVKVLREAVLDRSPEKYLHLACALTAANELDEARRILLASRKSGLDPRRLDADDRTRLETVEAALGVADPKS
jgi:tetratricopeptide (TPR) repeat protein